MPISANPLAVIIEPRPMLADTIADALKTRGFDVIVAATHIGGARAVATHATVDFLIAAVPAPGEDRTGAYLAEARRRNPRLRTIVMLSEPEVDDVDIPPGVFKLWKPFTLPELQRAIDNSGVPVQPSHRAQAD